jgi:glutamine---fructose-6-phosphate transaminase (isomerizing)
MPSIMRREINAIPQAVAAALTEDHALYAEIGSILRERHPPFAATVARGSSDHAASYAASLLGIRVGLATASLSPSLVTRYGARLALSGALVLAVSQSGASPDLVEVLAMARQCGALTVALVNALDSPLARQAECVVPQRAGPEQAVAATKSFVLSLLGVARLVATWTEDATLTSALALLPDRLEAALRSDWSVVPETLHGASEAGTFVLARGPTLAVAQEAALKLKETSYLHAEALSSAEIRHGPRAVIDRRFPVLGFALSDAGGDDTRALCVELANAGAPVLLASHAPPPAGTHLPLPPPLHPLLDPVVAVTAFYPCAEALAHTRGLDPDRPRSLQKVTRTV